MRALLLLSCTILGACTCQPRLVKDATLEVSPAALDFGTVTPHSSTTRAVVVRNPSGAQVTLALELLDTSRAGAFELVNPETSVAPGGSLELTLRYTGAAALSADIGVLAVREAGAETNQRVALTGRTSDGAPDAGHDAGLDAGQDAGPDAGQDAGLDAGQDAGFDAGQDAGFDAGLPVFDGGGRCGAANVLDVTLLPDAALQQRNPPGAAVAGSELALVWTESLDDAGVALFFTRLSPSGVPVVAPREVMAMPRSFGDAHLAWNGTEFAVVTDRAGGDGGQFSSEVLFLRLGADGALLSEQALGPWPRGWPVQDLAWNAATDEWAAAWNSDTGPTVFAQRFTRAGAPVGVQRVFTPATFDWLSSPLVVRDGGVLLASVAGGVTPISVRQLDGALAEQGRVTVTPAVVGATSLKLANGPNTTALVFSTYDGTQNRARLYVLDAVGAPLSATPVELAPSASSVRTPDVVWNGAGFTTVVGRYDADAGFRIEEARFSPTGQPVGQPRIIECTGGFVARLAYTSGVHVLVYDVSDGPRRLLLFP